MLPCGCGWAGRLFSCNGGLGWAGLELSGSHSFIFRTFVLRCGSQCYMFRGDYLDCRSCVGSRETTLVVEMPAKCKPRILMLHPSSSLSPSPCRSKTQKGAAKAKGAGKSKGKAKAKTSLKKTRRNPRPSDLQATPLYGVVHRTLELAHHIVMCDTLLLLV